MTNSHHLNPTGNDDMVAMEYEFITGRWEGVKGAAYNQCHEFCIEAGWIDHTGVTTPKGYRAIQQYATKVDKE